jgi:hypothetical protein
MVPGLASNVQPPVDVVDLEHPNIEIAPTGYANSRYIAYELSNFSLDERGEDDSSSTEPLSRSCDIPHNKQ